MKARGLLLFGFGLLKTAKTLSHHSDIKPEEKDTFSEYTATKTLTKSNFPQNPDDFSAEKSHQKLNIKLPWTLAPEELPLSQNLSTNYLMQCGATRSCQYELLARGDNRTIEQIR